MQMILKKVEDFAVTGDGAGGPWADISWEQLTPVQGELPYLTKVKAAWSGTGVYFLVDCEDRKLDCTIERDMGLLFNEDVVEVFLWPFKQQHVYLEYEISPLNFELPIIVPNHNGTFYGWLPWQYEKERACRHATKVRGGPRKPGAGVKGWSCEFFIPYTLLKGLGNCPPVYGTKWRANIYRIDYGSGPRTMWAWEKAAGTNFHNFRNFGTLVFE
jgi:hypothetical protein